MKEYLKIVAKSWDDEGRDDSDKESDEEPEDDWD